ncbi:KOW domain-containing RNA-binding protein [Terrilactibacillus laevilacticus]|uniref:RNA-binding protein n=1 Tax=Terrilactibacillus laevilacticus TaxID=1380157 RepID=A0ABW5PR71_9BACI|nr:KOW domain-containing RNA-binding protein [Terrilactibacillus laevilacticus]
MVSVSDEKPVPGQIAKILKGREAGSYCVIVNILNDRFVEVADGDKRKFDKAKKKNINHLDLEPYVSNEVYESIKETGRVTNGKIRFAVAQFMNEKSQ